MNRRFFLVAGVLAVIAAIGAGGAMLAFGSGGSSSDASTASPTTAATATSAPSTSDSVGGGGWLGVSADDTSDGNGVKVTSVADGSPASNAGIETGDLILSVDGEAMDSFNALASLIKTHSPGDKITVSLQKSGGDKTDVDVTLGSRPDKMGDLQQGLGGLLPDLGGIFDGFSLDKLIGGQLQFLDANGNVVTLSADAGKITSITSDSISIQPPTGDAKSFDIPSDAKVADGLAEGDQVVVVQKDGTVVAVVSTDISKLIPNLPNFHIGDDNLPDLFPGSVIPKCTIDDNGVNCDINVIPSVTPAPTAGSNSRSES